MATKNAFIRYKVLDNCFRNPGKRYFIQDLIIACEKALEEIDPDTNGISRRQILSDISYMESAEGWSIDLLRLKDGKRVYYRYTDPDFSINNMPLNEAEITQLKDIANMLSQYKGMPQFDWLHELVPKLNQGISFNEQQSVVMEFDSNQYLKGIEFLGTLYNSILYKKVLQIKYSPFEAPAPVVFEIHPYYLKQYNNRWFLFGYNPEQSKSNWNLAIDRIDEIRELNSSYRENKEIDWEEYFDDMIGVTRPDDAEIESVLLHFNGKTGHYVETKPIHGSQKSVWENSSTLAVRLKLIFNYEFERLLLSYAESVKVIEPNYLADALKDRLKKAIMQYPE
jgi:predicted DNA-binding transcriptional regulator YafY